MSQANAFFHEAKDNNNSWAFRQLKQLANSVPHDIEAINLLGLCYIYGYGVTRKPAKALERWHTAADLESDVAMCNLGMIYQSGTKVAVDADPAQAAHWFLESAKRNGENPGGSKRAVTQLLSMSKYSRPNAAVLNNLGSCYENGFSVSQNLEQAMFYYRKAAELGDDIAMCNLGMAYQYGRGVPVNPVQAEFWFQESVKRRSNNPTGSLRAAKQLEELAIQLANYLYEALSENGYSYIEVPRILMKLNSQHRIILQKDIDTLKSRRDDIRRAHPENVQEIEKTGLLIAQMQTIINYPCCIKELTKNQQIEQLHSDASTEARHLGKFIERLKHINKYTHKLKSTLDKIKNRINQEKNWQVKDLFGVYKNGMPDGIKDMKRTLDAMNTNDAHDLFHAYTQIIDILAAKTIKSSRRHPTTTQFYDESYKELTDLRFNEDVKNYTQQPLTIPRSVNHAGFFAFSPFRNSPLLGMLGIGEANRETYVP